MGAAVTQTAHSSKQSLCNRENAHGRSWHEMPTIRRCCQFRHQTTSVQHKFNHHRMMYTPHPMLLRTAGLLQQRVVSQTVHITASQTAVRNMLAQPQQAVCPRAACCTSEPVFLFVPNLQTPNRRWSNAAPSSAKLSDHPNIDEICRHLRAL